VIRLLGRIVADVRGGAGREFARLLIGQLDAAIAAADVIRQAIRDPLLRDASSARLQDLEHEGDRFRELLVGELGERIATPIDREDLFRLSRSIDDILDNLRDLQREQALFDPADATILLGMLDAAVASMEELRAAIAAINRAPAEISRRTLAARKAGNQMRRLYDRALGELFAQELSMETLKLRELLRRLDVVGLRLREAADALADAAIKRGGA
jgi:hypothetical protein